VAAPVAAVDKVRAPASSGCRSEQRTASCQTPSEPQGPSGTCISKGLPIAAAFARHEASPVGRLPGMGWPRRPNWLEAVAARFQGIFRGSASGLQGFRALGFRASDFRASGLQALPKNPIPAQEVRYLHKVRKPIKSKDCGACGSSYMNVTGHVPQQTGLFVFTFFDDACLPKATPSQWVRVGDGLTHVGPNTRSGSTPTREELPAKVAVHPMDCHIIGIAKASCARRDLCEHALQVCRGNLRSPAISPPWRPSELAPQLFHRLIAIYC
jgi:hypothetical protein